jgi:hypothetical protein
MAAAVIAARRQHRPLGGTLGGGSEGPQTVHALGGLSFDFSDRAKSLEDAKESQQKWKLSHQNFPKKEDILKDLELGVLVGRNVFRFSIKFSICLEPCR